MSIVHLGKRITDNKDDYYKYLRSNDSLIYDSGPAVTDESGPDCLSLTVGSCWYDDARYVQIHPEKGLKIKPHTSVVIETAEEIALPLNMYGLLFGAGSNIYRGTFISSGKIDPGFMGKLRVGFHNGSGRTVRLRRGDKLAYGIFVGAECDLEHFSFPTASMQPPVKIMTGWERFRRWWGQNIYQILTLLVAVISMIVSVVTMIRSFGG